MNSFYPSIYLKKGKERSILNKHPWIFSGALQSVDKTIAEGSVVEIFTTEKKYLATGHFHHSSIAVRILSFDQCIIDDTFWEKRIETAFQFRKKCRVAEHNETTVYRLVHGEGDHLSGLIIDLYDTTAVIQVHTIGMSLAAEAIAKALIKIFDQRLECVYLKDEKENRFLLGDKVSGNVKENNLHFFVDWTTGQKTGFFIDQRENRKLLQQFSEGKKVLNAFSYSGGFSVYAAAGNATLVHSVDSSSKVADWVKKNFELNFRGYKHEFFEEDVASFLKKTKEQYDIVIIDPPAFAKHLSAVKNATIGYRNLNTEAFKKVKRGGFMFTFSCSQAIDKDLFRKIVFTAAVNAGREVKILYQLSQPVDHPINIYHPEGEYLKGLVLYVE